MSIKRFFLFFVNFFDFYIDWHRLIELVGENSYCCYFFLREKEKNLKTDTSALRFVTDLLF